MLSLQVYKIVHIFGVMLLFTALGGLAMHAINGGDKASNAGRKLVAISQGVALLLIVVGGFGMLARLQLGGIPGWLWAKIGIWVVLGGLVAVPYRKPELARPLWIAAPLVGALAAGIAIYKPF